MGDCLVEMDILNSMGSIQVQSKDYAAAVQCFEEALVLSHDLGNQQMRITVLLNLGITVSVDPVSCDCDKAIAYLTEAEKIIDEHGCDLRIKIDFFSASDRRICDSESMT